jgi:hypothetical protein
MLKKIAVCMLALATTGCTTVIQPARMVTVYHPPAPVVVYSQPEVYYYSPRPPVVIYRERHNWRQQHYYYRRW